MPKLNLQGLELYYEMRGRGEPLLFIHGLGSSSRDWEHQLDYFSTSYLVVAFDLRGHGESAKPSGPYTMPLFAEDAASLLRALDSAPAHVVGISLGGMIALQLAVSHSEMVRSLTIVNTLPRFPMRNLKEKFRLGLRMVIVRFLGMRILGRLVAPKLFPGKGREGLRREFVRRWSGNDPRAYLESMRAIAGWSVIDHLAELAMPVLVVASEHDYTTVAAKAAYAARIPHAELQIIPKAHHAVTVEFPERFNEVLAGFLARV